jgi:hypothetical protein
MNSGLGIQLRVGGQPEGRPAGSPYLIQASLVAESLWHPRTPPQRGAQRALRVPRHAHWSVRRSAQLLRHATSGETR